MVTQEILNLLHPRDRVASIGQDRGLDISPPMGKADTEVIIQKHDGYSRYVLEY